MICKITLSKPNLIVIFSSDKLNLISLIFGLRNHRGFYLRKHLIIINQIIVKSKIILKIKHIFKLNSKRMNMNPKF